MNVLIFLSQVGLFEEVRLKVSKRKEGFENRGTCHIEFI